MAPIERAQPLGVVVGVARELGAAPVLGRKLVPLVAGNLAGLAPMQRVDRYRSPYHSRLRGLIEQQARSPTIAHRSTGPGRQLIPWSMLASAAWRSRSPTCGIAGRIYHLLLRASACRPATIWHMNALPSWMVTLGSPTSAATVFTTLPVTTPLTPVPRHADLMHRPAHHLDDEPPSTRARTHSPTGLTTGVPPSVSIPRSRANSGDSSTKAPLQLGDHGSQRVMAPADCCSVSR